MSWVALAIISHVFWGLNNIGEKFLIDKHFKNPYVYMLLGCFIGGVSLVILPFIDFVWPNAKQLLFLFISSTGYFVGITFYIRSVQIEEISRINVLWNFIPIFSFLGAWFFIGEKLSITEVVAFAMLLLGGFSASIHAQSFGRFKLSKALYLMLLCCVFFAGYDVSLRYLLVSGYPFSSAFICNSVLIIVISFVVLLFNRKLRNDVQKERQHYLLPKIITFIVIVSILSRVGTLFNTWAISLGPVSLVNAMEGFQVLFVFLVVVLISIFVPKIIKEEIDRKNIILKIISFIFLLLGMTILYLA